MTKYTKIIYKYNKKIMLGFLIISLIALAGILRINIKTDFDVFKLASGEYISNSQLANEQFGDSKQMIIAVDYYGNNEADIINFEKEVTKLAEVRSVHGLNFYNNLPFKIDELSPIKKTENGDYVNILLNLSDNFNFGDLQKTEDYLIAENLTYYIAGDSYMQNKIFDYIISIILFVPPLAITILFGIFYIQMKSLKATILSVFPAVISSIWTLGIAGYFGHQLSILTILAPIFTIIIGSADGLHFNAHLQEHLNEGIDNHSAIGGTLKIVGMPMIITTVTSVAGFIALLSLNAPALHDLAIFSSIGISLAGLMTFVMLPTIHSLEKIDIRKIHSKLNIKLPFSKLIGSPAILISIIICLLSAYGITQLNNEFNQLMFYKDNTAVAKNFNKLMEINGGSVPLYALVPYQDNPFNEGVAIEIEEFSKELMQSEHVSTIINPIGIFEMIKDNIPTNLRINFNLIKSSELYKNAISDDYIRLIIYPKDLSIETTESIISVSEKFSNIKLAGTQLNMYELNQQMLAGQHISLIVAFVIVWLALLLSLRKLIISLIALLPIAITALFLYGVMGLTGIPLNLFTATIFSITIGVGIDYAIHFVSVYNNFSNSGALNEDIVAKTYHYVERPIIANALGFALALSALMLSPLKVHFYISILMWLAMIVSATLSLSLLPTLLKRLSK